MKVFILTIGDELLIGQVVDSNSARMAQLLAFIGARVVQKTSVPDTKEGIIAGLHEGLGKADVILMTGGLGPTKDDITKKALAEFFGVGFLHHQETWERIQIIFEKLGLHITEGVKNQCWMPQNAVILTNKLGTAPGMWFEEKGKIFVSMPGVPFEMEYLMENEVVPRLAKFFNGIPSAFRTLLTAGEGESSLSERLKQFEEGLPENVKLAYLPGIGQVRLRLTVFDESEVMGHKSLEDYFSKMTTLIPKRVKVGINEDSLQIAIGRILRENGLTLSTAESCTGGYLAHLITSIPGSSDYFRGSIIAYSNEVKVKHLGVQLNTLKNFGAVSEETVKEMVRGSIKSLDSDVAIAISGIAGPDGGTPEKPVGTIWIAAGDRDRCKTQLLNLGKDRLRNIQYAAAYALNLLRLFVEYPDKE